MAIKAGRGLVLVSLLALSPTARAQDAATPAPDAQREPAPVEEPASELPVPSETVAPEPLTVPSDTPADSAPDAVAAPAEAVAPMAETAPPAPALPPAPDIAVVDSQLLATLTDPGGIDTVTQTTSIPYVVGRSCYNWALKYAPVEGDLTLSEELVLPGPARNWNGDGTTEVNAQRSGAITQRHFNAITGVATAGWCVAKDDPVGSYRYIIRQGEREVARFDFTVGDLL